MKKSQSIHVGDLGEAFLLKKNSKEGKLFAVDVYKVKEEDGTVSWQLNPDEVRGDTVIESRKAVPLDPKVLLEIGIERGVYKKRMRKVS